MRMPKLLLLAAFGPLLLPAVPAQEEGKQTAVQCRVMEAFAEKRLGISVAIFHQRAKPDGPRLGELLLAHSGEEMEFKTRDGRSHRATVVRLKSCFGRGLLLCRADQVELAEKEDFILRYPPKP